MNWAILKQNFLTVVLALGSTADVIKLLKIDLSSVWVTWFVCLQNPTLKIFYKIKRNLTLLCCLHFWTIIKYISTYQICSISMVQWPTYRKRSSNLLNSSEQLHEYIYTVQRQLKDVRWHQLHSAEYSVNK
jgi:hypothetical protein